MSSNAFSLGRNLALAAALLLEPALASARTVVAGNGNVVGVVRPKTSTIGVDHQSTGVVGRGAANTIDFTTANVTGNIQAGSFAYHQAATATNRGGVNTSGINNNVSVRGAVTKTVGADNGSAAVIGSGTATVLLAPNSRIDGNISVGDWSYTPPPSPR